MDPEGLDGLGEEADDDGGRDGEPEEQDGEVHVVEAGDDAGAQVGLPAPRRRVGELQAHPDGAHREPHHQAPERPLQVQLVTRDQVTRERWMLTCSLHRGQRMARR